MRKLDYCDFRIISTTDNTNDVTYAVEKKINVSVFNVKLFHYWKREKTRDHDIILYRTHPVVYSNPGYALSYIENQIAKSVKTIKIIEPWKLKK